MKNRLVNVLGAKILSLTFILLAITVTSTGQEVNHSKNTVYYELGGTGWGIFSLNYDRLIPINETVSFAPGLGMSISNFVSTSYTYHIGDYQFFIPWQANFIFGRTNHHFETGIGMPIAIWTEKYGEQKFGLRGEVYVLRFGYRYQPNDSGIIVRASINPTWFVTMPFIMAGLSIGYSF